MTVAVAVEACDVLCCNNESTFLYRHVQDLSLTLFSVLYCVVLSLPILSMLFLRQSRCWYLCSHFPRLRVKEW